MINSTLLGAIQLPPFPEDDTMSFVYIVMLIPVAATIILSLTLFFLNKKFKFIKTSKDIEFSIIVVAIMHLVFAVTSIHFSGDMMVIGENAEDRAEEWIENSAYPYIHEQEYIDREIVSIELLSGEKGAKDYSIKYKNDDGITETLSLPSGPESSYNIEFNVPPTDKQFIRFYQLNEDIGGNFIAGEYGLDIHLYELE